MSRLELARVLLADFDPGVTGPQRAPGAELLRALARALARAQIQALAAAQAPGAGTPGLPGRLPRLTVLPARPKVPGH
ncbi:MAG TPA: hypothetical protein VIV12_19425 [Streptosporangiaceae bacterium]